MAPGRSLTLAALAGLAPCLLAINLKIHNDGEAEFAADSFFNDGGVLPFIHIPNCAGTSFLQCTKDVFTCSDPGRKAWERIYPHTGSSFVARGCNRKLGHGTHCSFSEIDDCLAMGRADVGDFLYSHDRAKHRYITIVRNPIHRVLSEYARKSSAAFWPKKLKEAAKNGGLEAWVKSSFNLVHNRMVKHLTTPGAVAPVRARSGQCVNMEPTLYYNHWSKRYGNSSLSDLEDLINADKPLVHDALRSVYFVGLQDDLAGTVERLADLVARKPDEDVACKNAKIDAKRAPPGGNESAITPEILDAIAARNKLDIAFYRNYANKDELSEADFLKSLVFNVTWQDVFAQDYD